MTYVMISKKKNLAPTLISILLLSMHGSNLLVSAETANDIRIFGLVNRPLNLSHAELLSLPMVSEVMNLECVFHYPNVTFNWTGIPLFHLLTLSQVRPEAREVVFRASDGFSSSITIEEALEPTIILALRANGTLLSKVSQIAGIQGGFRIVVPCRWGYKWVADVREIEVVDYDYKGTYESSGFSDEAYIPECLPPSIMPPLQVFNLSFGNRTFKVEAFTNVSITTFSFNYLHKEIDLNLTVPSGAKGFINLILQQNFLKGPYSVSFDGNKADALEANVIGISFLYILFPEGLHTIKIVGTEFFGSVPDVRVEFNQTAYVGETIIFDASKSIDDGQIVAYEWDFGDGATRSGAIVNHSYYKEGTYQIVTNVTDNEGLSNFTTLIVNVEKQQQENVTLLRVFLAMTVSLLVLLFMVLLIKRKQV